MGPVRRHWLDRRDDVRGGHHLHGHERVLLPVPPRCREWRCCMFETFGVLTGGRFVGCAGADDDPRLALEPRDPASGARADWQRP